MPTFVRTEKCDGCKGQDRTACMYICPHDLMKLDKDGSETGHAMKSFNQEPEQCWECYSCIKICPQNAIECRAYADIVPMGGSVQPLRGTDSIMWTIKFRNGTMKRFKFPIRTTPEGSIQPYEGKPKADYANIGSDKGFFVNEGKYPYEGNPDELILLK
ncbi:adenylyl-sulfate reductase subunit beta [sulfur-oxidizing endosymbiont of Gigantopelta aegis]|uniref:adenylyl-sulfate reductase subunit beta n=1 Tax=sulfur-oxidizing endosymbiont of Gigantopelta aegis TaxID=2794934 RepID=UPI0018DE51FF|nr:adenylyl-sulfate reductase subunit beta [sulfur-oxidizing endosymbiont of Gigantopelta aegis]